MRQQITVYLEDDNRHWLRKESKRTGVGMSGLVNMFVAERRQASVKLNDVNRAIETARLADLENEEV